MIDRQPQGARRRWGAGALTGLVSASFSTLFVQLGSRHIGRDPNVDWIVVGTVIMRGRALTKRPKPIPIATGILMHSFADWLWATLWLGGVLGKVPELGWRRFIQATAVPWAAATAAAEYYVVLPWLQPILRMQVPYWTAFMVHVASASAYPAFLGIGAYNPSAARRNASALAATLAALSAAKGLTKVKRDPHVPALGDASFDRSFLQEMNGHHESGLEMADLCAERASTEALRRLAALISAQHVGELEIMRAWHDNWFQGPIPPMTDEQRQDMPGMPHPEEVQRLYELDGPDFDRKFIALMIPHHFGAIRMADNALRQGADPRVRLLADAIRHTQLGQVRRMDALRPGPA